ncbi:hypothetical protein ABZS81_09870 [Streptomyces sp. NPDC005318]|uniref:hypothetical protein n=1 Tax=Streptomyces sp. NPDC005318 TaxID=3157031 RepID=UPI00339FAFEC
MHMSWPRHPFSRRRALAAARWNTTGTGYEFASATVPGSRIWLRASADIRPGAARPGHFSYSTDGGEHGRGLCDKAGDSSIRPPGSVVLDALFRWGTQCR